jgi:hypothetical protein
MYLNMTAFGPPWGTAVFLTNAPFDFELADGTKSTPDYIKISLDELSPAVRAKFSAALDADFPPPRSPDESSVIRFERSEVPVKGFDTFLKGKLVDLVDGKPGVAVGALYRVLIQEITAKANDTTECTSLAEVFDRKTMCRGDFETVFGAALKRNSVLDNWGVIDDELKQSGVTATGRIKLRTSTVEYISGRSRSSPRFNSLSENVRTAIETMRSAVVASEGVVPAMGLIKDLIPQSIRSALDEFQMDAAFLTEVYEAIHG